MMERSGRKNAKDNNKDGENEDSQEQLFDVPDNLRVIKLIVLL